MTASRSSPNRHMLVAAARAVHPILQELTFVGGQVAELLVTDALGVRIRQTDDIDAVVAITSRSEYARLEDRLRALGLRHDTSEGAPICRWLTPEHLKLDLMPAEGAAQAVRQWLSVATREFLADSVADYAIEGALPDSRFDEAIVNLTRSRFAAIAALHNK